MFTILRRLLIFLAPVLWRKWRAHRRQQGHTVPAAPTPNRPEVTA